MRYGKTKVAMEQFHSAKKPIKGWDVNDNSKVASKIIEAKLSRSIWLAI